MDETCPWTTLDLDSWEGKVVLGGLVADAAVCVLILVGNAFVLCALLHQRWCRKETLCPRFKVSSLFVMNLAVADFLIGCAVLFYLVNRFVCPIAEFLTRHKFFCLFRTATFLFTGVISVTTLAAISIDRYVAIAHSLRYPEYMTRRRASAIICFTWACGIACAASLFFWNHFEYGQPCTERVVPRRHFIFIGAPLHLAVFAVILVTHLIIRREITLMRQRRKVQEKISSIFGAQLQRSSIKSMRAVVLVVGCYFVCWLPFMVTLGFRLVAPPGPGLGSSALDTAFQFGFTLANMNAMLNPFIYSWKNASVRTALQQFVCKLARLAKCSKEPDTPPGSKKATPGNSSGSGGSGSTGNSHTSSSTTNLNINLNANVAVTMATVESASAGLSRALKKLSPLAPLPIAMPSTPGPVPQPTTASAPTSPERYIRYEDAI